MGNLFNGSEVVQIGVQIEINGRDFYNVLVEKSQDPKAKEIFSYLAGEEERHIRAFNEILDSVQKYDPSENYPSEYFDHMNSLASEHVFTQKNKGEEIAKGTTSDMEALDLAMKFERDSIVFYEGMKKIAHEDDAKIIDSLIDQEKEHLMRLSGIKNSL